MKPNPDLPNFPVKYEAWLLLVFGTLVFLIYASTLTGPFIFDDKHNIQQNRYIRMDRLRPGSIAKAALQSPSRHRPVANVSFALNYYFHRYNPVGYHFVNILIHIINGTLLYLLAKITLLTPALKGDYDPFKAGWIPLLTALIWTLHPLQTQSVSYIVQRMNSLATLFYLLCLWFYVKYRLAERTKQSSWLLVGCAASGVLAVGSKEIAATLPLFIILYEWFFFQGVRRAWLKKKIPLIAAAFIVFAVLSWFFLGMDPLSSITTDAVHRKLPPGQRVLTEFRVVVFYLSLLIWPHPSRLNLDHDFMVSNSLTDPVSTLLSLAAIAGMVGAAIFLARKTPLISFAILWFFGNLVIESSVIDLEIIFEHRAYLPSSMLIFMLVSLIFKYVKPRQICIAVLCAVVAVESFWTYQRNRVWADAVTLWQDCVAKSPGKARPYNNLGVALAQAGQLEAAIENYYHALRINPDYGNAHYNLGSALARKGNLKNGTAHLLRAVELQPDSHEARNNLGIALLKQGELPEAITQFRTALQHNADDSRAHNNLGIALGRQHHLPEAVFHFREALRLDPAYAEAHNNLGDALRRQGKFKEAHQHFSEALRINPAYEAARKNYTDNLNQLK
jgi:tetratricopeptide (TPR) repeat protein